MSAEPTLTEAEIRALEKALTTGTGRYDPIIPPSAAAEPLLDDGEPLCIAVARIKAAARREALQEAAAKLDDAAARTAKSNAITIGAIQRRTSAVNEFSQYAAMLREWAEEQGA